MCPPAAEPARKFDRTRAGEYETQSRIALAGYDGFHELSACMLATALGPGSTAHILVAGAGGGAPEILNASALEPDWRFTAVDPSESMMDITLARLKERNLTDRTTVHLGYVEELPAQQQFDAATLIGVLHHLPGRDAKRVILRSLAARLKRGAPLVVAGNRYAYDSQPVLLAAWRERWRMKGASPDEVKAKLAKIMQGADPPESEEAIVALLRSAGFACPIPFFSSLFWSAWLTRKMADIGAEEPKA